MATKQEKPGYVYILTNPSFREDWVKIGKSSRPVDVRSKELDNTAVPLPFEIYATMKTVKYNEAEKLVHKYIERFTNLRIRSNREFFNVKPEEALEIFKDVAMLIDDVEIELAKNIDKPMPVIHHERVTRQVHSQQIDQPTIWLIPGNSNYFDLKACYKEKGQVYWTIRSNFKRVKAGDRGYIYSSRPDKAILYSFDVVKAHLPYSPEVEAEDKYEKREIIHTGEEKSNKYALLKLEAVANPKKLSLERLIENGLTSAPQAAMILSQKRFEKLLIYIEGTTTSSNR